MNSRTARVRHSLRRVGALAATGFALLSNATACQQLRQRPLDTASQARWTHDSAAFAVSLRKWVRDSVVRDSISRTISTDSLFRLYHQMLYATDPVPVMFLVTCETDRLTWRYGSIPALDAMKRMSDTLYKPGEIEAAKEVTLRLQRMSPSQLSTVSSGPQRCGDWGPRHPVAVDGAAVSAMTDRPRPPRHP